MHEEDSTTTRHTVQERMMFLLQFLQHLLLVCQVFGVFLHQCLCRVPVIVQHSFSLPFMRLLGRSQLTLQRFCVLAMLLHARPDLEYG